MPWCATHHRPSLLIRLARMRFKAILHLHRQQRHSRFDRADHTRRKAATQIEPQEFRGIDLELIDRLRFLRQSGVDFEGFCGTGKPRVNLWATPRPDKNQAVFLE